MAKLFQDPKLNEKANKAIYQNSDVGRNEKFAKGGNRIPRGFDYAYMRNYTPQQEKLFAQSFEHVSPDSYTARLARGDKELFNEMEEPSMREFNALQGQTASRFSGRGQGGRRSSNFQNTNSQANMDFASQLASRRQDLSRNAIKDLMEMSHTLLGERPFEQALVERPKVGKKDKTDYPSAAGGAVLGGLTGLATGDYAGGAQTGWEVGKQIRKDKYGEV